MRVISWNMAYWKPAGFNSLANRRRQWSLLGALSPDVALLQECRPSDLADHAPVWMTDQYDIIGEIPAGWTACSAVLIRAELLGEPIDPRELPDDERRWLGYLSGYVAAASVGPDALRVASVHGVAKSVDDPSVTGADHERIRRSSLASAWHNDLAVAALTPWVEQRQFIIGGDWNNALLFDTNYPEGAEGGPGGSAEFFARMAANGWCHALRKYSPDEVRTYLDSASDAYELDHLFTDEALHQSLTDCRVMNEAALSGLSDHAMLIAEIDL